MLSDARSRATTFKRVRDILDGYFGRQGCALLFGPLDGLVPDGPLHVMTIL